GGDNHRRRIGPVGIRAAQTVQLALPPRPIGGGLRDRVVRAEREDVEEPPDADAGDLARDPLPQTAVRLADHDRAGKRRKRSEPAREPLAIEIGAFVADEKCAQRALYQQMPRYSACSSDP